MSLSRRSLLTHTAAGCAVAAAGPCLLGAGCGFDIDPAPRITGSLDDDPSSARYGQLSVSLAAHPELQPIGTAVIVELPAGLATRDRPFQLPEGGVLLMHRARAGDQAFAAVGAICPHAACPLGYSAKEDVAACPCHGSRFLPVEDPSTPGGCAGAVVRGPARSGVRAWPATLDAASQTVRIDLKSAPACTATYTPSVVGGQVVLPLDKVPALGQAGGSWVGQPMGLGDTLIVVRVDATRVIALSAICTHLQCIVEYNAPATDIVCRCHMSMFDLDGKVTQSPAPTPLKKYAAVLSAQAVTVTVA